MIAALKGNGRMPAFRAVGVFVNEGRGAMRDIVSFAGLDAAQIHGDENPSDCASFDFPWYRALRIASVADAQSLVAAGWDCPRILVDARVQADAGTSGSYGGTGSSIGTWAAIAAGSLARELGKEYFVAGGIKARNVASFVHSLGPDGLDVSSGVEEAPGKALFRAKREAAESVAARETEHAAR
jgi:phosphoribosylanthranilate isomerase